MGCCVSTEAGGQEPSARRHVAPRPVEVVWEADGQWEELSETMRRKTAENESKESTPASQQPQQSEAFFAAARSWLDKRYRDCARTGTIEEMVPCKAGFATSDGPCTWASKEFLTLDCCYTGTFLACTFIVAAPLADGGEAGPAPGAMLGTPQMEGAKARLTAMFSEMEKRGSNMDHAEMHIFMGADMVRGKWRPGATEPTVKRIQDRPSPQFEATNDSLAKTFKRESIPHMAMFLPLAFTASIGHMLSNAPGAIVWDEGELPFAVAGKPYPNPTRLLVARDYREMDREVQATHYKIACPITDPKDGNCPRILRNAEPDKDPGGVFHVTLLCSLAADAQWPRCGAFANKPQMKAAEAALAELLKRWNRQGKVQRCEAEVLMGADKVRLCFVGERIQPVAPPEAKSPSSQKLEGDIEGFVVKLVEEPRHELFESESHFQAVKATMQQSTMQNPESAKAMVLHVAEAATRHFLEMNYPGTEVSNEGAFPVTVDGEAITIADTVLMVARDPNKEQKSVVAVVYSVPSPDGESPIPLPGGENKNWLDSAEMKVAEATLLDLMKQWHREGKISEGDCMAQVMMGMDASLYRFVDGERFDDYSEERMKEFRWG